MNNPVNTFIRNIAIVFVLFSVVFYLLNHSIPAYDFTTMEVANTLMAALCTGSYLIVKNKINVSPQAFVRGLYITFMLRLFVGISAIFIYLVLCRNTIYKPVIFVLFGIYAAYTVIEKWMLSKIVREKK